MNEKQVDVLKAFRCHNSTEQLLSAKKKKNQKTLKLQQVDSGVENGPCTFNTICFVQLQLCDLRKQTFEVVAEFYLIRELNQNSERANENYMQTLWSFVIIIKCDNVIADLQR